MLTLHFANRQETLVHLLTGALHTAGGDPFTPGQVIVPSAAQRKAVTLAMAQRHGVCANLQFAFLAPWLWQQGARVLATLQPGGAPLQRLADSRQAPWQPALLTWRVLAAFADAAWLAQQPRLARYLAQADAVTRLDLAQRVAGLVDQHITYRPDWLAAWSEGRSALAAGAAGKDDEAWQAALWRRLQAEVNADATAPQADANAAHQLAAALQALPAGAAEITALQAAGASPVAHVFCLPTIAPVHLALLQQLARWMDVHIHAINPCAEYWFDVVEPRRLARLAAAGKAEHLAVGNRLLAAWGQQAQAQLAALVDACGDGVVDDDHHTPHPGSSLLATLHNAILNLEDLAPASVPLLANDRSIELHVCHSLTRELEVLHDRLLALLAGHDAANAPTPGDILVTVPDLDAAVPLIDAVFGSAPPALALPYTITGRPESRRNPAARALLDLLALVASRCTASAVFGLLQQPVVAQRFGLDDDGLTRVHGWLLDAGVHWALDGAQRAGLGLPDDGRSSFDDGLERLFLGHSLPSDAAAFDGRLPVGEAEGGAALALGALWQFIQALQALRAQVATPQPAQAWPALLAGCCADFIDTQAAGNDALADLRSAMQGLAQAWRLSAPTLPLALDVVREALTQALDDPARGGVPTGRITFAAMPSLRGLPYKVICMLGLNDGAFPADNRPAEFDLIAQHPRAGDRQRRQDERNLFLDLLLAARDRVYLSHTGRSVRDNAALPPSVLVAELLDVLVPALDAPAAAARAHLVVAHPLQAFDVRGFQPEGDVRLRSFHADYAVALQAGRAAAALPATADARLQDTANSDPADGDDTPAEAATVTADTSATDTPADDAADSADTDDELTATSAEPPFFPRPLPALPREGATLAQLQRFFRHPARWLLQQRMGLTLRQADEALADDEPFLPGFQARNAVADHLLPALLQPDAMPDDTSLLALAQAGTALPAGAAGSRFVQAELPLLRRHAWALADATQAPLLPPHSTLLALRVPDASGTPQAWPVHITLNGLRASGLLRHRYADAQPADHIAAWLEHLALCACAPAGVQCHTRWLGRDGGFALRTVDEPLPVLQHLLWLFGQGQCAPLPFFPKAAWAWLEKDRSLGAARAAWLASARKPYAEQADASNRLAWRGLPDPLGADTSAFEATAAAVLEPLFAHLETDDGESA